MRTRDGWNAALVATLGTSPALALLMLTRDLHDPGDVLTTSALVGWSFILGAAALLYWQWRTSVSLVDPVTADDARFSGWLTVGMAVTAIHGLAQAVALVGGAAPPASTRIMGQLVVLTLLCTVAALSSRVDVPGNPGLIGIALGLALTALTALAQNADGLAESRTLNSALATLAILGGLLLAWLILQHPQISAWTRRRLALAAVALTGAQLLSTLEPTGAGLVTLAVVANLGGAVALCLMTHTLLRRSFAQHLGEVSRIRAALDEARSDHLHGRELMHEISSTLAGITHATRMVRQDQGVSPQRREKLEMLLTAELARLQRLMSAEAPVGRDDFEVDDVVERIALSHQTRGRDVAWEPCGLSVRGNPDDLAEVVNVLLENAARHAGGSTVRLSAATAGAYVELRCRDTGPGIDPAVLPHLFQSGSRCEESVGQGLGLAIARRLMVEAGGGLDLRETGPDGTTFAVRLPLEEVRDDRVVAA